MKRTNWLVVLALAGTLLAPVCAHAQQAWLPPKGEGSFSLGFSHNFATEHIDYQGNGLSPGDMVWNGIGADLGYDRSQLSLDVGYLLGSAFTVPCLGTWEVTHDGWRVPIDWPARTSPEFVMHDQVSRERYFQLGGAVSYSLSGSVDVNALAFDTLSAENYVNLKGLGVSLTYSASPAQLIRRKRGEQASGP